MEMLEMEMLEADPIDVLLALIKVEESIQVWKAAVVDLVRERVTTMNVAKGPFRGGDGPLPPSGGSGPFTNCWPDDLFMGARPQTGCAGFNIDTYVQQVSGLFLGLYFGLEHPQRPPTAKTS